jgi:hypothetical protein
MKRFLVGAGMVACSSSATPPPSPTRPVEPALASRPDASPPPAIDAAPPEPAECADWNGELALDGDALRSCWYSGELTGDELEAPPPDRCAWLGRDGAVRFGEPPAAPTETVTVAGGTVEVCLDGACVTLTLAVDEEEAVQVRHDRARRRIAVEVHDELGGGSTLAVFDARRGGKPIARARREAWDASHASGFRIGWLGELLIWVEYPGATIGADGELWRIAGKKLKRVTSLPGFTHGWGQVGPDRYAIAGGVTVAIHDGKGKRRDVVHVDGLVGPDQEQEFQDQGEYVQLVARDGGFVLIVESRAAFVDLAAGTQTVIDLPGCG